MYLVEVILLIDFIVAKEMKRSKIDIVAEKGRSKTTAAAEKNIHNMTVEENNNDDNKAGIAIYADSGLIDLADL